MQKFKSDTTTGGHMTTMPLWYFVFAPMEQFQSLFFNIPGCVHNSQVAEFGQMYDKFKGFFRTMGAKCCIDSAFGNVDRTYLYKSS
jgi:hypothetical protein